MVLNEKGILRQFSLVVYPIDLVVAIGDMEDEINKRYIPRDKQYDWLSPPPEEVAEAAYNVEEKETGLYCLMIWIPKIDDCKGSYFCHESGHLAIEIFKYIGAHIDYDDQEPFCYLLGTIFRLINGAFYELKDYKPKKSKKK